MFRSHSEVCRTKLDRRFVEDGGVLKCGPPGTDNKNEPFQINEDAKGLWLKFKFVQFARKWVEVEGRSSMKRRRMNEVSGTQVGAEIERILESEQNVERKSPQNVPSFITMPSVVRNVLNKNYAYLHYTFQQRAHLKSLFYFIYLGGESDLQEASPGVTAGPAGNLQDDKEVGRRREQVNSDRGAKGDPYCTSNAGRSESFPQ
jgi:hypothetical protein